VPDEQPLRIEDHGAVRVLTLNRPEKKNAFSPALANALTDALVGAAEDDGVRVVVVTAAGDTFSAGVDVSVFLQMGQGEAPDVSKLTSLHETLRRFPKPLIAAVQGKAVGMGVTLLPHFDMVYAAKGATFLTPFVRLGLVLEYGSSFTLPRLLGRQRANDLILRGKPIDSAVAEEWGLVTRTFASDELLEATLEVATQIAATRYAPSRRASGCCWRARKPPSPKAASGRTRSWPSATAPRRISRPCRPSSHARGAEGRSARSPGPRRGGRVQTGGEAAGAGHPQQSAPRRRLRVLRGPDHPTRTKAPAVPPGPRRPAAPYHRHPNTTRIHLRELHRCGLRLRLRRPNPASHLPRTTRLLQ
jgi:enoyl-CoA hydratase/carnithine racemase